MVVLDLSSLVLVLAFFGAVLGITFGIYSLVRGSTFGIWFLIGAIIFIFIIAIILLGNVDFSIKVSSG